MEVLVDTRRVHVCALLLLRRRNRGARSCKTTPQLRDGASDDSRTVRSFSVQPGHDLSKRRGPVIFTPALSATPLPQQLLVRSGFDLTQVSAIDDSLRAFGKRFAQRLFTQHELDYAGSGRGTGPQRLAARFAAKEAVIKALGLSEAGVNWRDIEVVKLSGGECTIRLHGRVAQLATAMGARQLSLSLSHEGDYAGAVVTATFDPRGLKDSTHS
ncbi:MAG: holo-ACP synthase [Ramlibacter sp.]